MWCALLVQAAVAFGPPPNDAFYKTKTCPQSGTPLQECEFGCAEGESLPTLELCVATYCSITNTTSSNNVQMGINDGTDTSFFSLYSELCGCWVGTETEASALHALSITSLTDTNNQASPCDYEPLQLWNETLYDQDLNASSVTHYMNHSTVKKYCYVCNTPTNEPTAAPTEAPTTAEPTEAPTTAEPTAEPSITTTITSTTTTTLTRCETIDSTAYRWPPNIFASQTGCLLQIARDGPDVQPWPEFLTAWTVTNSSVGGDSIALAGRLEALTSTGTLDLDALTLTLAHGSTTAVVQLAAGGPTINPTAAPTVAPNHVCAGTEVGLHFVGDVRILTPCDEWQPAFCSTRADVGQCQCFCGVPHKQSVKEEETHALVWTVLAANAAVFVISLSLLFFHLQ